MDKKKWKDLKKGDKFYCVKKDGKAKLYKISEKIVKKVSPCCWDDANFVELKYGTCNELVARKDSTTAKFAFMKQYFFTTREEAVDSLDSILYKYKEELEEKVTELVDLIVKIDNLRETI